MPLQFVFDENLRYCAAHLRAGVHSPGIFVIMGWVPMPMIIDRLVLAAYASGPEEWVDRIYHITR